MPIRIELSKAKSAARKFLYLARTTTPNRRECDEQYHLEVFREASIFPEQQHAEAPAARKHTADSGGDAELDESA